MSRSIAIAISIMSFCMFTVVFADASDDRGLYGSVSYTDSSPVAGAVIYALGDRHKLSINNNIIMVAENIPRAITDANGNFYVKTDAASIKLLFVRDMEDNCAVATPKRNADGLAEIVMQESAMINGKLFKGDKPVTNQKITAYYKSPYRQIRYTGNYKTNGRGQFKFRSLIPGSYLVQVSHEVPQVGCCFSSIVTKRAEVEVLPGSKNDIKLGGTDLPYLKGKITNAGGGGLHGVWVQLKQISIAEGQSSEDFNANPAWSEVTEKDGSYQIYDIPPGEYMLHCFRRLAYNNSSRTLQTKKAVSIKGNKPKSQSVNIRAENTCDVSIDLQPFMPLEYGQQAPLLIGTLDTGKKFNLAEHKGKIVVLHFYASWCSPCVSSMPEFDRLSKNFDPDKLLVVGISLDDSVDAYKSFISQKNIKHPMVFAGPWQDSQIRMDFRVLNVPTSFVINADGKIAQKDIFGKVLEEFVKKLSR